MKWIFFSLNIYRFTLKPESISGNWKTCKNDEIFFISPCKLISFLRYLNFSSDCFDHVVFICYLAAPWPTWGHYGGGSLNNQILIATYFNLIWPEGCWESHDKVQFQSLTEPPNYECC